MGINDTQRTAIRDVVLTHAHLDHIAGLPLFIDDLFATLERPIRVHAAADVIEVLEHDIFNWSVYPRFSDLTNDNGKVMEYVPFEGGKPFEVGGLTVKAIEVNHKVPSSGFIISDDSATIALSGDTAEMDLFWAAANAESDLSALLIECAFPDELTELADISHHLTPSRLKAELDKFVHKNCPIYAINIKPAYRTKVVAELDRINIDRLRIFEAGKAYEFTNSLPKRSTSSL